MTGRVQSLRSSVAGNRPTGRAPGELYINFPDMQLGVINAASAAQDLLAVRMFSTTTPYAIGDHVLNGGVIYRAIAASAAGAFVPANWSRMALLSDTSGFLPLAGGVMTGALTPSQTAGIVGTTAANNVNPGGVGEFKKAETTTNVSCPNSGQVNVATLPLTAGDWDVYGIGYAVFTGTPQEIFFAVTLTSATVPTATVEGCGGMDGNINNPVIPTGPLRVSIAATTNVYLVGSGTWTSTGSCNLQGLIRARRVR